MNSYLKASPSEMHRSRHLKCNEMKRLNYNTRTSNVHASMVHQVSLHRLNNCNLFQIVLQKKPEDENQIKQCLKDLVDSLDNSFLVSSTICVSESNTSPKYYGVSMSTTGPNAGKIVIAASCLSYWDDYVAGAVMTYYPKKQKKPYFDGTIELPACVTCKAYGIRNGQTMDPCRSCGNLFGLQTNCQKEWPYGNCAEDESLSNLLKKERDVREKVISQPYQQRDRDEAKDDVLKDLKTVLKTIQFKTWDGEFYRAQPQ